MVQGMGTDDEKSKHNPDADNLKSLLKKSDKRLKSNHRVIFNENKNEFFDADYIILIREECDHDEVGVCSCSQHEQAIFHVDNDLGEITRSYEDAYEDSNRESQGRKFTPPYEFVDAVTLSPPEGYKDLETEERQLLALQQVSCQEQRAVLCHECRANYDDEDLQQDSLKMNKMPTAQDSLHKIENVKNLMTNLYSSECSVLGILKGGHYSKHQENLKNGTRDDLEISSDDDGHSRRSVRFECSEDNQKSTKNPSDMKGKSKTPDNIEDTDSSGGYVTADDSEMTLELGSKVLGSNNSSKPNSAVQQLFPYAKPSAANDAEPRGKYLITADSLRAFEEAKRSKLLQIVENNTTKGRIKVIERNTLRRSLIRYEPKNKKNAQKVDNSLVELIKQLTCNIEDENQESGTIPNQMNSTDATQTVEVGCDLNESDRNAFSSSSSSTTSSNSSTNSSTYTNRMDLIDRREKVGTNVVHTEFKAVQVLPDVDSQKVFGHEVCRTKDTTFIENKKQFFSTIAPLTACVSGVSRHADEYCSNAPKEQIPTANPRYYANERADICEHLKDVAPDVLNGTLMSSESREQLAGSVGEDVNRMDTNKKKYQPDGQEDEDDFDDYGFNKRPSVRSIKPQLQIPATDVQEIGNDLLPVSTAFVWPYYSENGLTDAPNMRNVDQNMTNNQHSMPVDGKVRDFCTQSDYLYQPCPQQQYLEAITSNLCTYSLDIQNRCNGRPLRPNYSKPLSPPPQEISRNCHQTMVYIPYNHLEDYQQTISSHSYSQTSDVLKVSTQTQVNKKSVEPIHSQPNIHQIGYWCNPNIFSALSHKESKAPSLKPYQFSKVSNKLQSAHFGCSSSSESVQTAFLPPYGRGEDNGYKTGRMAPKWAAGDACKERVHNCNLPLRKPFDETSNVCYNKQANCNITNGCRQSLDLNYYLLQDSVSNSPMKTRFFERGTPEGADSPATLTNVNQNIMSPTSSESTSSKFLFYAMNV